MITQTNKNLRELDPINGKEIYLYGCLFMCYVNIVFKGANLVPLDILELYKEAKNKKIVISDSKVTAYVTSAFDLIQFLQNHELFKKFGLTTKWKWSKRSELSKSDKVKIQPNEIGIVRWRTLGKANTHFTLFNQEGEFYDPFTKIDRDVNYDIKKDYFDRVDIITSI